MRAFTSSVLQRSPVCVGRRRIVGAGWSQHRLASVSETRVLQVQRVGRRHPRTGDAHLNVNVVALPAHTTPHHTTPNTLHYYLSELCTPVAQVARQHLRSASHRLLAVPTIQLDRYSRRAFAVVGPTAWNALGNNLCDPCLSIASFGRLLKTHLFQQYSVHRAHYRHCAIMRYIN